MAVAQRRSGGDLMSEQIRFLASGLARYADEEAEEDEPKTVYEWALKYRRIDGQQFTLDQHLPLVEIYKDEHPSLVLIKPAQRGASELAICYTMFALDRGASVWAPHKMGLNVGYIFPTNGALRDFSKERLSGLSDESSYLRDLLNSGRYQDVTFKQIRSSFLYLRGGWSKEGLKSFPADVLVLDEYDEMNTGAVALADKRMNASSVRRKLEISTPILPGIGIHARYMHSDQRVYIQQCPECGGDNQYEFFRDVTVNGERYERWQYLDPEEIIRADVALTCPHCEVTLDRAARCRPGVYVPQAPEVLSLRGYHIPPLAFPLVSLRDLAMKAVDTNATKFEEFMRQDLGVPYHSSSSGITEEQIIQLSLDLPNGQLPQANWKKTTMGVDVGSRFHCKIVSYMDGDTFPYVRAMTSVTSWAEVDNLMSMYAVRMCVVDAYPEAHGAASFVSRHKGRAVLADYPTNMGALRGQLFTPDPKRAVQDGFVRVNRTMALDAVQAAVVGQREHWPRSVTENHEVLGHMTGLARVTSMNAQGQVVASWVRLKADHFFHASAYELVARSLMPLLAHPGRVLQGKAKTRMPNGTNYQARDGGS